MMKSLLLKFIPQKNEKVNFNDPIFHLRIIGMDPTKKGVTQTIFRILTFSGYWPFVILCLVGLFEERNVKAFRDRIDLIMPQIQIVSKTILLFSKGDNVAYLISKASEFGSLGGVNKSDRKYICGPHKIIRIIFKSYQIILWINIFIYFWSPLLLTGRAGITLFREKEDGSAPYFVLQNCCIFSLSIFAGNLLLGYDGLFYYLLAHAIGELRVVRKNFEELSYIEDFDQSNLDGKLKIVIERHIRILGFIKYINKTYSIFVLAQYMATLVSVCAGLFFLAADDFRSDTYRSLIYITSFLIPTWVNCYFGDILHHECLISDAIFYKDWGISLAYQNKAAYILSIQRSQRVEVLSIGGFAALDLHSFTQLIKISSSFYAMVNSMQNKS